MIETATGGRGRIKVIAGTGANSTSEAVERPDAAGAGADGSPQVTLITKPTQEGLYRISAVADIGR